MNRATQYLVTIALILVPFPAFSCDTYDATLDIWASSSEYYSAAMAACYVGNAIMSVHIMIGHAVSSGDTGGGIQLYSNSWETYAGEAQDTTHWPGGAGECFWTDGSFFIRNQETFEVYYDGTATGCACIPSPPSLPGPVILCDDGSNTGNCSPIVLSESGRYALSGTDDPVLFDMNGDGLPNRITWTARGSAVAFLAMDRNQNGTIDNGSELFGNWTMLATGARATNGFVALEELDANADGVVNVLDARWSDLLLWTDASHDGASQPGELRRIDASTIEAISTVHHWTGRRDPSGNLFGYAGLAFLNHGARAIWDVYFRSVP